MSFLSEFYCHFLVSSTLHCIPQNICIVCCCCCWRCNFLLIFVSEVFPNFDILWENNDERREKKSWWRRIMLNSSEIPQTFHSRSITSVHATYDKTQFLLARVEFETNKKGILPVNVYFTIDVIGRIFVAWKVIHFIPWTTIPLQMLCVILERKCWNSL